MIISFVPRRCADLLEVVKAGDALTINGEVYDFAVLPDGGTLPVEWVDGPDGEAVFVDAIGCPFIETSVHRIAGELHISLVLPVGPDPTEAARFPVSINPPDGPISLPE